MSKPFQPHDDDPPVRDQLIAHIERHVEVDQGLNLVGVDAAADAFLESPFMLMVAGFFIAAKKEWPSYYAGLPKPWREYVEKLYGDD